MKNRVIKCVVSKTVQEKQFEPYHIELSLEGSIPDTANLKQEYNTAYEFLEDTLIDCLNTRLT